MGSGLCRAGPRLRPLRLLGGGSGLLCRSQLLLGLIQLPAHLVDLTVQALVLGLQLLAAGLGQVAAGAELVKLATQLLCLANQALVVFTQLTVRGLLLRVRHTQTVQLFAQPGGLGTGAGKFGIGGVQFGAHRIVRIARICALARLGAGLLQLFKQLGVADLQLVHEIVDRAGPVAVLVGLSRHRKTDIADLIEGQSHLSLHISRLIRCIGRVDRTCWTCAARPSNPFRLLQLTTRDDLHAHKSPGLGRKITRKPR